MVGLEKGTIIIIIIITIIIIIIIIIVVIVITIIIIIIIIISEWSGNSYFNGYIDDFRIYTTTLNANDVTTLYSNSNSTSITLDKCQPGYYYSNIQKACTPCEIGTYAPNYNIQGSCTSCPNDMTTIIKGAVSITSCISLPSSQPSSQPSCQPSMEVATITIGSCN